MDDSLSDRWHAREQARLRLAQLRLDEEETLERALERACWIARRAISVDRISVWRLVQHRELRCIHVTDPQGPPPGALPSLADLGPYEHAMAQRRVVAAPDVSCDPVTRDLVDAYFAPLGIVATLDAPMYRDGKLSGMVCFEQRSERPWSDDEADFCISTADMIGALFLTDELRDAHEALGRHEIALREAMASEAMARIARGVAHDVNNVLAVVFTAVLVLERANGDPARTAEATVAIRDAAESAAGLVRQLLAFGRPAPAQAEIELDAALLRSATVLQGLVGEGRRMVMELGAAGRRVALDATQLDQIVTNLIVNARDASPEASAVTVRTEVTRGGPGEELVLEVRDEGSGMDELTRARLFEPFFTTKTGDGHAGLGMAIVDGVVRAASGRVEVESAPGAGTRISVVLPVRA
jgi:K+-sensing histidine kinase KdpD